MEQTRFQKGWELLRQVDDAGGEAVIDSLAGIAPDLGRYIVEFAFGDIYAREGLSLPLLEGQPLQERELVTIASLLTAGGCEPQLRVHLNGGLNVGLAPEKIVEALIQCVPYVGFPRVLNAVATAREIFASRGL